MAGRRRPASMTTHLTSPDTTASRRAIRHRRGGRFRLLARRQKAGHRMSANDPWAESETRSDPAGTPVAAAGMVYLLHFSQPYKHAKHYTGFAESPESLKSRLFDHE